MGQTFCKLVGATIGLALAFASATPAGVGAQSAPMAQTTTKNATPKEGEKAQDFSLVSLQGRVVRLSAEIARGPVVLVVLRGWPGYQCPFCTRQFGEYLRNAADIEATGAHVLFVYPGPAEGLKAHAEEFTKAAPPPAVFQLLLDPDYAFTLAYGLRWDAPQETAYPSTFVLDRRGVVTFARTSRTHGDRVPVADVLKALAQIGR
ncbi:MAG TPA: peroxiredoxin family protein [Vicinamibacterales bacterium]|nr:peroxiredoxin family protein [Vicinamibacterales bacterium]